MKTSTPLLCLVGLCVLSGCATETPAPMRATQARPPDTNVYFYPKRGGPSVSPQQQDRDKYECNSWAVQQTGFDPSLPDVPRQQRVLL